MADVARCSVGEWVEVERVLLEPAERSANLPEDTAAQPLMTWVKGFALAPADMGGEVSVTTMTGRTVTGTLSAINPGYFHTFGQPIPELVHVGADLRAQTRRVPGGGWSAWLTAPTRSWRARARSWCARWGWTTAQFEQSPIAFDYEAMMASHGYSLDDIVGIQTRGGVGNTPLLELRNLTDLVRSYAEPGFGARIFVKDEAANMAGSFKDRRASVSIHVAAEQGYAGVIAATSGNYGAAVASQSARNNLNCIIVQEAFDSRHVGQPEIIEKSAHLRGVRRRGRAAHGGSGAVQPHARAARRDRLLRRVALLELWRVRHRDPRPRDRQRDARGHRQGPRRRGHHARRRRQHHRHRARPEARWRDRHADRRAPVST